MTRELCSRARNPEVFAGKKPENLLSIKKITKKVEKSLDHFGVGQINPDLTEFKGQLSTDPKKVGKKVNRETLIGKCQSFTEELQRYLALEGLNSRRVVNSWRDHFFLKIIGKEGEIIIDPAIGQFLDGYNHIFIGTSENLEKAVLEYAKNEKLFIMYKGKQIPVPLSNARAFSQDNWSDKIGPL
jgi:hypothetical protein